MRLPLRGLRPAWGPPRQRPPGAAVRNPGRTARPGAGPLLEAGPMCTPKSATAHPDPHAAFLAVVWPRVERHARIYFRHLRHGRREEAVAEAVGLAWLWCVRL